MKKNRQSFRERWNETIAENEKMKEEELAKKEEADERLRFEGKYSRLFHQVLWKNFRRNLKDYLLLLICNTLIFGCAVVALGMKEILSQQYVNQGLNLFSGLEQIFLNAIIPIAVIAIIIFILLFFYYIKCRGRNFGVFLTLGMRRNQLYKYVALEYVTVLGFAVLLGGIVGAGVLFWFVLNSEKYLGVSIPISAISIGTFGTAIVALLYLCVISVMFARSIFVDFNVGRSTDLRAIGEKMPMRFRKIFILSGVLLCGFSVIRYQNLNNYENVYLLFLLFIGLFLVVRFGMAEYLIHKRKNRKYLKKLMVHNQLYHKSRTSSAYIMGLFVIQFCILFYFLFSAISVHIAENPEELYPYDVVCLADDKDDLFFEELTVRYNLEMYEFPAFRVSAYDSTESRENGMSRPIQGQHVGISESTYHKLKKQIDSGYKEEPLGLDSDGKNIYIVYQQDESVKAHPIGYYIPRKKPTLHIGRPCPLAKVEEKQDSTYYYYEVKGQEIGSLVGVFGQGMKENIVVFSDEYFEQAKEFWKTTEIITGKRIEKEEERIEGVTIFQGITKLVLINMKDKNMDDMKGLIRELDSFEQKHIQEEDAVYTRPLVGRGLYDASVSYHYMKEQELNNLVAERLMKLTMNYIVMLVFFTMNLMIVLIYILSEKELNARRAEFLNCMGMYKKKRISLIRNEIVRYYSFLPSILAIMVAVLFTVCTFYVRMYTPEVINSFLERMVPFWLGYFLINMIIMWMIATIYAYRVEGTRYGRNS